VAWGGGSGGAADGLNNWDVCPRFAVRCRLARGSDIAGGDRLGSFRWSFRRGGCGSGVGGLDLGVWQQHYPRAGSWRGGAIGPLVMLARLCARGERLLDRREERRAVAPPMPTKGSATAGTGRCTSPRTRTQGSGPPATASGRAIAHRRACRPTRERPPRRREYLKPA
jgi:hypothetical protein